MPETILLCPLAVEAAWMASAAPELPRAVIVGPGEGVRHWIAAHARPGMAPILCGLGGALRGDLAPSTATIVTAVIATEIGGVPTDLRRAPETSTRESTWPRVPADGVVALTVPRTVTQPAERNALATTYHRASVVDCESWWFAVACAAAGLPWLVVRGISDGPTDRLPAAIDSWVGSDGRTRLGAIALSLLRRPTDLACLPGLARRGRLAMHSVAEIVRRIIA